jgi:O-antigen/teichoic acid export membrane protein
VVPLISLSYFLSGSVVVLGTGLRLAKKTSYIALTHVTAAILNVILNYLLVPSYGMMGAAATSMISYLFIAIVIHRLSSRFITVGYEIGRLLRIFVATVATVVLALFLSPSNPLLETILRTMALALFPLVLFFIGFFTKDEKKQIKRAILHPRAVIMEASQ